MSTTPNMLLDLPQPSVTPGPEWASELIAALQRVDLHDHTSGFGVPVPTAGLNINADLNFSGFNAFGLRTSRYNDQASTPINATDICIVYVKGGELTYKDILGNEVPITANGSVAGSVGNISGLVAPASASFALDTFTWLYDSGKPARMANGDILLYPYDGASTFTNSITLKAPTSLAAAYSIELPDGVPTTTNVLSMTGAGNIQTGLANGTISAPSLGFTADPDTGLYLNAGTGPSFVKDGVFIAGFGGSVGANGILVRTGSAALPGYAFASDTNSGMYPGTSGTTLVKDAVEIAAFGGSDGTFGVLGRDGSVAKPTHSFFNDSDTGLYSVSANQLGVSTGGVQRALFNSLGFYIGDGSMASPSYSFLTDPDTGFFIVASNGIGVSCGADDIFQFRTSGVQFVESGVGQGIFKMKVFTGTFTAVPSLNTIATLTSPGTNILSVSGYYSTTAGTNGPIGDYTANDIKFLNTASTTTAVISNGAGAARTGSYQVTMFYQG